MTTPTTFKDAYAILKANADHLEHSPQLDIDNLVAIVDESIQAYKVCQDRLNAIEQALAHAFDHFDEGQAS
ncbi:exodeoxyribonuclease VII small subunit [Moraxella oblonga]|uniref:exodeoxyribonuclease VII small subunit n=1 Tax=Moraxella oblonga TaxID=200413 RepID=UPI00082C771F|nr:exodeoxyribonuclease VII small subunit [Moraxella oblonga]